MTAAPCGHVACTESPAVVLDCHATLPPNLVAYVLDLRVTRGVKKGEIARRQAVELMQSGVIAVVDPTQPTHRWSVSAGEIRRYLRSGPRTGADIVPLRSAS